MTIAITSMFYINYRTDLGPPCILQASCSFMISLGVLAFYAIQIASQAGWSPVLFRVMEGITSYLIPGGIIMLILIGLSAFHFNHLFVWADPEVVAHDKLIQGKVRLVK